jgi:hypothetical protein
LVPSQGQAAPLLRDQAGPFVQIILRETKPRWEERAKETKT